MKPLILLNGAGQLGPNAFQLFSKLGMGILELVPFLPHLMQHPLVGLQLAQKFLPVRILSGSSCNVIIRLARMLHRAYIFFKKCVTRRGLCVSSCGSKCGLKLGLAFLQLLRQLGILLGKSLRFK